MKPRTDLFDSSLSYGAAAIDALCSRLFIRDVQRLAIDIGAHTARAHWYRLHSRILRLTDYCAQFGHTLVWGRPWPNIPFWPDAHLECLAIYVYIRANDGRIIGRGYVISAESRSYQTNAVYRSMCETKY